MLHSKWTGQLIESCIVWSQLITDFKIIFIGMQQERSDSTSTEEQTAQGRRPHKNTYEFSLEKGRKITISSNFDNGNVALSKQVSQLCVRKLIKQYKLEAVPDYKNKVSKKTWFHFWASAPKGFRVRFILENVPIFQNMYEDHSWAKPLFKNEKGSWQPIKNAFLTYREEVGLVFDHTFLSDSPVYFSLAPPHSYNDSEDYLQDIGQSIPNHIHYQDNIIGKTNEGLNVHVLTLTQKETKNCETKPIVLITCRVHPGEVGSTYCLMGIIDFLLRPFSLQAYILLHMFQFVIFPMVNPDGVMGGNYRMDLASTNLNRVYNQPSLELHPSVYFIKQHVKKLVREKPNRKIMFHFDLHSHSVLKPAFIYGNAFEDLVAQTQSALFCKLLEQNCEIFKYGLSQFTEKHMKMKDKGETMTKEGCARVVLSKLAGITYSYTLETSIFPYQSRQTLASPTNTSFKIKDDIGYEASNREALASRLQISNEVIIDNMMLGHGLMVSILDLFQKNPYSRFQSLEEALEGFRKQISQTMFQSEERFKLLDNRAYQKAKAISKLIRDQYHNKYQPFWSYLANCLPFSTAKWPDCIKWFQLPIEEQKPPKKDRRVKTETIDTQKQISQFVNPKNTRRNIFNFEQSLTDKEKNGSSPNKASRSSRGVINLQLPTPKQNTLPEIRNSMEKQTHNKNSRNRGSSNGIAKAKNSEQISPTMRQYPCSLNFIPEVESDEIKRIEELTDKEATKNIVLSFIHDEVERMNNARKSLNKNSLANHRLELAHQKSVKKRASKSLKMLMGGNQPHPINSQKRVIQAEACEDIVNRRKIEIEEDKKTEKLVQVEDELVCDNRKIPGTCRYRESMVLGSKREIAKVKYSQIKKKNIIRQQMNGNLKLPQLRMFQAGQKPQLCINTRALTTPDEY